MKRITLAAILLTSLAQADEKAYVDLTSSGYSSSGGGDRPKAVEVEVSRGFGSKKNDIPVAEQIAALKSQIGYLTLMEKHGIDISKEITAKYAEKPLAGILKELLPGVPVKFDGVDEKETVKQLNSNKARLSAVIEWLDDAAGVYFTFSETGIVVTSKPPVAP